MALLGVPELPPTKIFFTLIILNYMLIKTIKNNIMHKHNSGLERTVLGRKVSGSWGRGQSAWRWILELADASMKMHAAGKLTKDCDSFWRAVMRVMF